MCASTGVEPTYTWIIDVSAATPGAMGKPKEMVAGPLYTRSSLMAIDPGTGGGGGGVSVVSETTRLRVADAAL